VCIKFHANLRKSVSETLEFREESNGKVQPKRARQVKSKEFAIKEFALAAQTVNSVYYCDCMKICEDFTLNSDKITGC
jgi:hypothetical protein